VCNRMTVGDHNQCPHCGALNYWQHVARDLDYEAEDPAWDVSHMSVLEDRSRRLAAARSNEN